MVRSGGVTGPIGTGVDYQADVQLAQALRFLTAEGYADSLVEASMRVPLPTIW